MEPTRSSSDASSSPPAPASSDIDPAHHRPVRRKTSHGSRAKAIRLSPQKMIILAILSREKNGCHSYLLHEALHGVTFGASASERASLSRSIRRLEADGLVCRSSRGWCAATPQGRRAGKKLPQTGLWSRGKRRKRLMELERTTAPRLNG